MKHLIHRISVGALTLVVAAVALPASFTAVVAQEDASSPLEALGLPTLDVSVTSEGITVPAEIEAGLVQIVGASELEGETTLVFAQLPDGVTGEMLVEEIPQETMAEWVGDATIPAVLELSPMATTSLVVNFPPGEYSVAVASEAEISSPVATLTVTGDAVEVTDEIAADLILEMGAYVFDFPESIVAGPQIWRVNNSHTVPHHFVLFPADGLYSSDEILANLMSAFSGTPVAKGFDLHTSPPVYIGPMISGGQSVWVETDLEPGFYVAICFLPDPGSDVPHVMAGMVDSFEVIAE